MKVRNYLLAFCISAIGFSTSAQTQLRSVTKTFNNETTIVADYKYVGLARPMMSDTGYNVFDNEYLPLSVFADSIFYPNNSNQLVLRSVNSFGSNKITENKLYDETGNFDGITHYEYYTNGKLKAIKAISADSTFRNSVEYHEDGRLDYNIDETYDINMNLQYIRGYYNLYDNNNRLITKYSTVEFGSNVSISSGYSLDSIQYYYSNANSVNYDSSYTYRRVVYDSYTPSWDISEKYYTDYNTNGQLIKDSTLTDLWSNLPKFIVRNYENYSDSTLVYLYTYLTSTPNNVNGGLERILIHKSVPEGMLNGILYYNGNINAFNHGFANLFDQNNYYLMNYKVVRDNNGVYTYEPRVTINRHSNNNINYIDVIEFDTIQYRVNYNYASENTYIDQLSEMNLNIYPNPSLGIINIDAKDLVKYNVEVYNAVGQLLAVYGNNPSSINISNQPVGSYILKINDLIKGESAIQRVNKQ